MKAQKQTSVSKLVARFDNELKMILMADLKLAGSNKAQLIKTIQQKIGRRQSAA